MAVPKPLAEVAADWRVSPRTVWTWVGQFDLTKYQMPGQGKTTHLDPDEVRAKVVAVPKRRTARVAQPA